MTDVTETATDLGGDPARRTTAVPGVVMREARLTPIPLAATIGIENARTATPDGIAGGESGNGTATEPRGAMRDVTMKSVLHDETVSSSTTGRDDESESTRESGNANEAPLHHPRRENQPQILQTSCLCSSARGD